MLPKTVETNLSVDLGEIVYFLSKRHFLFTCHAWAVILVSVRLEPMETPVLMRKPGDGALGLPSKHQAKNHCFTYRLNTWYRKHGFSLTEFLQLCTWICLPQVLRSSPIPLRHSVLDLAHTRPRHGHPPASPSETSFPKTQLCWLPTRDFRPV